MLFNIIGLFNRDQFSQGGRGAGYRAGSEEDTYDHEGKRMFHVRGSSDMNAKAMQVCTNSNTKPDSLSVELVD